MPDPAPRKTAPFRAVEPSRVSALEECPADGCYRVLATLGIGTVTYRVLAELVVDGGRAEIRFHRFDAAAHGEWFADRKISMAVAKPGLEPPGSTITGADFVLAAPVRLDGARALSVFGPNGFPAT